MIRLICGWFGHKLRSEQRSYYEWPGKTFRSVADEVTYEREVCFCGDNETGWREIDRDGFQSLAMPDSDWKELRRTGRIPA